MKRIDGPEIDEIRRDMLTGRLIRKAARVGWKNVQRRWKSRTTTAQRPILRAPARRLEPARRGRTHQFRLGSPLRRSPAGLKNPPIKPEGGPENPTPGLAVRSLNRSDIPCRLPFIIGLESLGLTGEGSQFIVGLASNQWTFSRFISGPTSRRSRCGSRARQIIGRRRGLERGCG